MAPDRFTIRWDENMGMYRVNQPCIPAEGDRVEVVPAKRYDSAVDAARRAYAALTHDDLSPEVTEEAVEEARAALADILVEASHV